MSRVDSPEVPASPRGNSSAPLRQTQLTGHAPALASAAARPVIERAADTRRECRAAGVDGLGGS